VPATNARVLLLTPRASLPAGRYRVLLSGASAAALRAHDAQLLTMPPADAGGDRVISQFTVATTP
jgi:hypothetical protein